MIEFFSSTWLYASAGIIIPVLIHLWNVRQGKVLRVGSIALLTQSDRQQARSLKLKDLLLLIIRCLLIIALACLLATPYYKKQLTVKDEKGWILASRSDIKPAYTQYKSLLDSLTSAGFQFHYFEPSFPAAKLEEAVQNASDSTGANINYWAMIKALNQQVPADLPLYVFTNNLLKNFNGRRPAVALNLNWKIITTRDTLAKYIADAYRTNTGSIRLALATSTPLATSIQVTEQSAASLFDSSTLSFTGLPVSNAADRQIGNVQPDTSTLTCVIYTTNYAKDAAYVQAALQAIQQYAKRSIKIKAANYISDLPEQHDWLFWLADQPVPLKHQQNNIVYYATGKVVVESTNLYAKNGPVESIPLQRRIQDTPGENATPVWVNGFGDNILGLQKDKANWYAFYSRFNPMWNDLVWSSSFPALVMELLYGPAMDTIHAADIRTIDDAQIQPVMKTDAMNKNSNFFSLVDLSKVFWLLVFVLFCIERYLSFKGKKEVAHA